MTEISVNLRGLGRFRNVLERVAKGMSNRAVLHERYGIEGIKWVDQNFKTQGALVGGWRPLSPNTIAGRRKGSSVILQDTGHLRISFNMKFDDHSARVGSPMKIAEYHEKGTRPYDIRPVRAKVLAFPAVGGRRVKHSFSSVITKTTYRAGTPLAFARFVRHPGLPARRMLPRPGELLPTLVRVTRGYIAELTRRGERL